MEKVSSWKELTLREKIGQTVCCLCETDKYIEMFGSIENFLKKYPVGAIYDCNGFVNGLMMGAVDNFKEVVKEYNKYLRVPAIAVSDDGQCAINYGVSIPSQMTYGAANDMKLSYEAGEFRAEDYINTGIDWGLWPECDISISKHSPVLDTRCVSDNWELVTNVVREEIRAMKDKGVIATIKHYPGAPYNEYMDSHLAPVDNKTPMELWRNTYGKMYKTLIDAGVPAIMTAHINLVNYQTEKIDDVYPGATMSYELTTKLLREELGFKGVTITDALCMGGFSGTKAVENTVKSFLAGNDMLLWPSLEYIDEMERKILAGEIDEKLLDVAVERIWNLKQEYGTSDKKENTSDVDGDYFYTRCKKATQKALTLLNNFNNMLPLNKDNVKKVYIIGVTPDDGQYEILCSLKEEFEKYGCNVTMKRNVKTNDVDDIAQENDIIVYALSRTVHRPMGPIDFWGAEATSIWASNCSDKTKTIILNFGSPYIYRYYKNSKITYINTYNTTKQAINSVVKGLFGEIEFTGKSSVELEW